MCRLILIIGNINIEYINKFLNQSINKKNTPYLDSKYDVDYHKNGFGLSWIDKKKWIIYKLEKCFTEDKNIKYIINNIKSEILVGHIRAINNNTKQTYFNTHPFQFNNNIWCHNGSISKLEIFKEESKNIINENLLKFINGNTDSEYLFYFFLSIYTKKETLNYSELDKLINTTIEFFSILNKKKYRISANIIFSNENNTLITRFVNVKNNAAPSLYENYINDTILISSEPILEKFKLINNNTAIIYDSKRKKFILNLKLNKI